jgi:hypothetical protein
MTLHYIGYVALNGRTIPNNEIKAAGNEVSVAIFKTLTPCILEEKIENHEEFHYSRSGSRLEPGTT